MILINTAGKVGSEAAEVLVQRDEPVRVLVREPQKATALRQLGVDVAEGDLDNSASIDAAMHGVTSVVLVSPAVAAQELNVIDSATRAGVGHVVKITSKASAESPIARQRGQAEIEAVRHRLRRGVHPGRMTMPTYAITGASGQLGRVTVHELLARGGARRGRGRRRAHPR